MPCPPPGSEVALQLHPVWATLPPRAGGAGPLGEAEGWDVPLAFSLQWVRAQRAQREVAGLEVWEEMSRERG